MENDKIIEAIEEAAEMILIEIGNCPQRDNLIAAVESLKRSAQQEFEDRTREAIEAGGGCSVCGDLTGFECICEEQEERPWLAYHERRRPF